MESTIRLELFNFNKYFNMHQLAQIFKLDYNKQNASLGLIVLELILAAFVVLYTKHDTIYIFSVIFGTLFVGLSDPGGAFRSRSGPLAVAGIGGAILTVLGYNLASSGWGWITIVVFVVTLLSGLTLKFGAHWFATSLLLNAWFIIALGIGSSFDQSHISTHAWEQTLAWLCGGSLWVLVAVFLWVVHGQTAKPLFAEIPSDSKERKLTKPMIAFAVIRAIAMAIAVAIPFGLNLSHGYWIPIATMLSMKANLTQATIFSFQRITGTIIGTALAAALLWGVNSKLELITAALILLANGGAIRFVNYAWYTAATAAGALFAIDLFTPTSHTAEWQRVGYTFIGLGIGVLVMFIAITLGKRKAKSSPQPAT
ncbi:MAG TPA: FUSC family protein [Candidatus Saccharimonadales bacterium]|nr:FUSC family protein [Candidatus Saccharimonadales bacterium]